MPRRVLIVDDNVDAAHAMRMVLEGAGHTVHVVHDGASTVPAAAAFRPDVVLLDLGLPDANGLDVARTLRNHGAAIDAQLVVVTGFGRPEDRRRSREAGFDEHVVKPVDPDALLSMVEQSRSAT